VKSPAPKANDGLDKAKFYDEIAKTKNGLALGVRVNAIGMCLTACSFENVLPDKWLL